MSDCGGPLSFSPGAARVTCPYCDTEFETAKIEEIFARQEKMAAEARRQRRPNGIRKAQAVNGAKRKQLHEGFYLLFLRRGNRQ